MSENYPYEIESYTYDGLKTTEVPISKLYKKIYNAIKKKFKNMNIRILSRTTDEDKFVILVSSDTIEGMYYLYNSVDGSFTELNSVNKKLDQNDMAEMKPFSFKSRDGLQVYGYLTIPTQASKNNKVPLLVRHFDDVTENRSRWEFSNINQLFASRGYAVLQINPRGSKGYGSKFQQAGNKELGRKISEDYEDGIAFIKKKFKFIDTTRVGIYGSALGGLKALQNLINTPELFKAGIILNGVNNIFTYYKYISENKYLLQNNFYLQLQYRRWYDERNPAESEIITQVSPVFNADKIMTSLFITYTKDDDQVTIKDTETIVENLQSRGIDVAYMVLDDNVSILVSEIHNSNVFQMILGFLAKHLKNN